MGIEGVNARIASIQSRMIALQTQQNAAPAQTAKTASGAGNTTFASYLNKAVQSNTVAGPAAHSHELDSKGVPVELAKFGNGKIPENELGRVGETRHRMWAPAAESLNRMIEDAKRAGVKIGITDSYRPYEEQVDLVRRKGLYSQGGLAAKPGTSEHGWGMATDLDLNGKALTWMRQNAEKYGFSENVPREPWHWEFKPKS